MGKYERLADFLRRQRATLVPMTFSEIERVIGDKLPPLSPKYPAWWSNNPSNNVMTKEWLRAGFRTEQVDVKARRLVFRRIEAARGDEPSPIQAPEGQHPMVGALRGSVVVADGVDLTAPADPDWANAYDD